MLVVESNVKVVGVLLIHKYALVVQHLKVLVLASVAFRVPIVGTFNSTNNVGVWLEQELSRWVSKCEPRILSFQA